MLPNFMLIGPGRAGSDWITKNLALHPDIYMPRRKVTRFFSDHYDKGIDWYSDIFGERPEKAVGEASVGYMRSEAAPARIARHLPNVKLIANLRDPVERAYSSFGRLTGVARPGEPNYQISFEDKVRTTPRLLEASFYGSHLRRWYEHFPKENLLVLAFDDMKADPARFLKSIYRFLEVDTEFQSPLTHQRLNATSTISSKSRILYYAYRGLLRFDLFGLSRALDTVNRTERPPIDPRTRKRLIEEVFLPEILEVEELTGREFPAWKT
jgi:hypothetical protein